MKKLILSFICVLFFVPLMAQHVDPCGFDAVHQRLKSGDKRYDSAVRKLDQRWISYSALASSALLTYTSAGYVYEIPTVVHVIHTGGSVGSSYNPDSTKIAQMIDYMNKAYGAQSPFPDTAHGGCRIPLKFVLAKRTPTGASTNGIVRVDGSSVSGYTTYGANAATTSGVDPSVIMALSRWPPADYYNVYSVNKIDGNDLYSSGGIAGFAYFPGSPYIDGMIVAASQVTSGSTTVAHEFGHAFGLYHTFEGDAGGTTCPSTSSCSTTGDLVCDTEPHIRESSAFPSTWCPPTDYNSCTGGSYNNTQYNIMDYTTCPPNRFTAGQRSRVLNTLDNERVGYKTSLGLAVPSGTIAAAACTPSVTTLSANVGPVIVDFNGMKVWTGDSYSENAGYVDHAYTQQSTVKRGNTYTVNITTSINKQNVRVFIDMNSDGDFADAGEQVFSHNGTAASEVHTGTITIPTTITTCTYLRMRVVSVYYGAVPTDYACGPYTYGQAEDYGVYVVSDTPAVTTPITYCAGAAATALTATGANLKWYTAATGGTGSTTAPTPSTTSVGSTTYYVTQSGDASATCESDRKAIVVNITAAPAAPTVTGTVNYCAGATASALSATGTSLLWYTAATGGVGSATAPTPSTATAGSTTYYVSQTTGGCESPRAAITVNVNAIPSAPAVASPVNYCLSAAAGALTATGSGLLWYSASTGGTGSGTAPTPSTAALGITNYYVSQTVSGCESPRAVITVNVSSSVPAPAVSTPVNYCVGATASALTAIGSSLLWYTAASGGTGSSTAPTPATAAAGSTTYYVSQTVSGCESPRAALVVAVNSLPAAPAVVTPVTYCLNGASAPLSASKSLPSDTLLWYSTASGGTAGYFTPTPATTATGTTNYWVSLKSAAGCEGARSAIAVTVNPLPANPVAGSGPVYCAGAAATALTATKGAPSDTLYWYTVATGGTGTVTAPVPSTATAGTTNYWVSSKSTLGCESGRSVIPVTVNAAPAAPSVSPVSYCSGVTAVPLTATLASASDTLYWYSTATGGTGSTTAPTPSTATAGTTIYYVSERNSGLCESPRSALTVTVNATPAAPAIVTPLNLCIGATASALTATGTNLLWYSAASGGSGSTTAPVPSTAATGTTTFYVSQTSSAGCEGPRAALVVNVNALPAAPTVSSPVNYCQGATATALTATKPSATDTLYWYTVASGGTGVITAPVPATGIVGATSWYVAAKSQYGCMGTTRAGITVNVNPTGVAPVAVTPVVYCQNATATPLSATATSASDTLKWYTVATGGTGSNTALTPATGTAGTFSFYVSQKNLYGCESPRTAITVTINALPAAPVVTTPVTYCQNDIPAALTATGTSLLWYTSVTGTGSTTAPTPSTLTSGTTPYYVTQTSATTGCQSLQATINVVVNPLPSIPVVISPVNICYGDKPSALSAGGTTLLWYAAATGGTGSASAPVPPSSPLGTSNYYVSQTSLAGCEGPRAQIIVNVRPLPVVNLSPKSVPGFVYCPGSTVTLQATSTLPVTYQWYAGTVLLTGSTSDTLAAGTTAMYRVVATTIYGCKDDTAVSVTQDIYPTLTPPESTICEGAAVVLVCHPGYTGNIFDWKLEGLLMSPATPKANTRSVSAAGNYSVTATSIYGCVATTNTATVTFYPKPVKPHITRVDPTLSLSPSSGYLYVQWYRNGYLLPGANSSYYVFTGDGRYYAEITDLNGCTANSDTVIIEGTFVPQVPANSDLIKVHPNPASTTIQIESAVPVNAALFDITGRRLMYREHATTLDISQLPDATYIMRLYNDDQQLVLVERIHKVTR